MQSQGRQQWNQEYEMKMGEWGTSGIQSTIKKMKWSQEDKGLKARGQDKAGGA